MDCCNLDVSSRREKRRRSEMCMSDVVRIFLIKKLAGLFVVSSKCRHITGIFWPIGLMVVSAVDLLYVFGRYFVLSELTPLSSVRCEPMWWYCVCRDRPGMWVTTALNNISVFVLVWHVFMSIAHLTPSTAPPLPYKTHSAQRPRIREVHQLDRAAPLKVRACRGTWKSLLVEVFTLRHALCRSDSKVGASALTATPKFEGGPARDLHGARVARMVKSSKRQMQNIRACAM